MIANNPKSPSFSSMFDRDKDHHPHPTYTPTLTPSLMWYNNNDNYDSLKWDWRSVQRLNGATSVLHENS